MRPSHLPQALRLHAIVDDVVVRRQAVRNRIQRHLAAKRPGLAAGDVQNVRRVCVLSSSSRGGTSVTAELLQWQGADCDDSGRRMLTLPGEEKPHLILARLAFPGRLERYDDLEPADARAASVDVLRAELSSEAGRPMAQCDDLKLYALQLYRRLLLQWPLDLLHLDLDATVASIAAALTAQFGAVYRDSPDARRQALACCARCLPSIRASFYDRSAQRDPADLRTVNDGLWSLEETPFVFPPPWSHATADEMAAGTLLLRDPSNAWRLPFWRVVFAGQRMELLHLVRDVQEAVQGLCDGWHYPFGFQTLTSARPLVIPGYTDPRSPSDRWKRHRLNFSISRALGTRLLDNGEALPLVDVCGTQWCEAHEQILSQCEALDLRRVPLHFARLRERSELAFSDTCEALGLEASRSGQEYARQFPGRLVMATIIGRPHPHERWKTSPYTTAIRRLTRRDDVARLTARLKLSMPAPARHDRWRAVAV